jgi:aspartate/methionine/tyrosine aminotransferase
MLEVCSTTLPQKVLPKIMGDRRYYPYLRTRTAQYARRADVAVKAFSRIPQLIVHRPEGAFYLTVVFRKGSLKAGQSLPPANPEAGALVKGLSGTGQLDKRFVYQLLASTGVCVVPLSSGFNSDYEGFRMTLLETDDEKFKNVVKTLCRSVVSYLKS